MARKLLVVATTVVATTPASAVGVGPRGPIGPDVPLSEAERQYFVRRVVPEGRTAAAVQAAAYRALNEGIPAVFLPAGEYAFETTVRVFEGLVLLGEGSETLIRAADRRTVLFTVIGDNVRFTRLKLQGFDASVSPENNSYGISVSGRRNVRIDHCELLGFSHATSFGSEATGQVDHCYIHRNLRDGLGYGVSAVSGAYVLIIDNEFSQNRHSLASNGTLDWSSPQRVGMYLHKPGRKTHWEFLHNRVQGDDLTTNQLAAVDTHPGMDGTFVVEANLFENLRLPIGIRDGSGLIYGNLFRKIRTAKTFRRAMAVWISYGTHNGIPVENAMPHDIRIAENTFLDLEQYNYSKYSLGQAENITIDGRLAAETQKDRGEPLPIPWLEEMGEDGVLNWLEQWPTTLGMGGVTGVVTDQDGRTVAGATVLVGDRSAMTGADGQFAFPEVSAAARFVVVSKPGIELAIAAVRVLPDEWTSVNIRLPQE